jgi:hypothetical protein
LEVVLEVEQKLTLVVEVLEEEPLMETYLVLEHQDKVMTEVIIPAQIVEEEVVVLVP